MFHCYRLFIIETLRHATPLNVFCDAAFLAQLIVVIVLVASMLAVMVTIMRKGRGCPRSSFLSAMGQTGLICASVAAGYEFLRGWLNMLNGYTTQPVIMLPSLIEVVYILVLGLAVWGLARWGNSGRTRMRHYAVRLRTL